MAKIKRLIKGSEETLLQTAFANENVMVPLGALCNLEILPTGAGELIVSGEKAVLRLTGLAGQLGSATLLKDVYLTAAGHLKMTNLYTDGRLDDPP